MRDKLRRLQAAMVQQEKVIEELTTPWKNLDSDVLRTKPVSLPRTAGVVHPERVILPVGRWRNKGRDLSAVVAKHRDVITPQQIEVARPWLSRKRCACLEAEPSSEASTSELRPVLGPVWLREADEKEHCNNAHTTRAAKRVHYQDGIPHVKVVNRAHGGASGSARRPTQDKIEESQRGSSWMTTCSIGILSRFKDQF